MLARFLGDSQTGRTRLVGRRSTGGQLAASDTCQASIYTRRNDLRDVHWLLSSPVSYPFSMKLQRTFHAPTVPPIAKWSTTFQCKIIIFQGQFHIIPAFSIESSPNKVAFRLQFSLQNQEHAHSQRSKHLENQSCFSTKTA